MKRFMTFAFSAVMVSAFFGLMHVKSEVQRLAQERRELTKTQQDLRESLRVLKAEKAHLTNPKRLQAYAEKMGMVVLEPTQIISLEGGL